MFGRRRRERTDNEYEDHPGQQPGDDGWPEPADGEGDWPEEPEPGEEGGPEPGDDEDDWPEEADEDRAAQAARPPEPPLPDGPLPDGPWDAGDDFPRGARIDFGSLLVPERDGFEVHLTMADMQPAWVTVVHGESGLQLQAFAAPKSSGLWEEVRGQIAQDVAASGGSSQEEPAGRFGPELNAMILPTDPADPAGASAGAARGPLQPVRFLGADGPRWFLRGLITGAAATSPDLAAPLEDIFSQVVVVRGDHPVPPRDLLEIQLPEQARQALAEQAAAEEDGRFQLPDPFDRGPEITETR